MTSRREATARRRGELRSLPLRLALCLALVLVAAAGAQAQEPGGVEKSEERVTITGRVVDGVTRAPLAGVLVELAELGVGVETDVQGRFEVKGIRKGVYTVAMSRPGYRRSSGELAVIRPGDFVTVLMPVGVETAPPAGRFVGRVTDRETGRPLPGAEIQIPDAFMGALTEEDGRFGFEAVPPGRYAVEISYLGYEGRTEIVEIGSGLTSDASIPLSVDPIEVEPIDVTVERRELFLEDIGFYERRDDGFGVFLDLQTIEARAPSEMTDLFRSVPGAVLVPDPFEPLERAVVLRGGRLGAGARTGRADHCYPMVVIDGLIAHRGGIEPARIDHLLETSAVLGVEVFPSSVGVPIGFAGVDAACGVIMFWTRR